MVDGGNALRDESLPVNLRFGRTLLPVGIVNRKHEPPAFNGVEVARVVRVRVAPAAPSSMR